MRNKLKLLMKRNEYPRQRTMKMSVHTSYIIFENKTHYPVGIESKLKLLLMLIVVLSLLSYNKEKELIIILVPLP